jgi:CheY-like chemotaxis protein
MALKGGLEELALLDILQVVAFSRKTGVLIVRSPAGSGAVLFKEGLVYCAFSPSTIDFLQELEGPQESEEHQAILLEQIQIALQELIGQREGTFEFGLKEELPTRIDNVDLRPFFLAEGVNTQSLLLNLAKEIDDERQETSEILESVLGKEATPILPEESPPTTEPTTDGLPSVVLVDDEEMVIRIVAGRLRSQGYSVVTATGPAEGLSAIRSLIDSGKRVVLITDLRMPTTTGRSFLGGFELVRDVRRSHWAVPVLLMSGKLTTKGRSWARKLGIRQALFKPAISKLDPNQYEADLRSFASLLKKQLDKLADVDFDSDKKSAANQEEDPNAQLLDYLTTMSGQLTHPSHKGEISKMVLQVASKYMDRVILFLIKKNNAVGLGSFGLAETAQESFKRAHNLLIDINRVEPFAKVVRTRKTRRQLNLNALETSLFTSIGRGSAQECILIPLLHNREVLAILYGDNAATGKPLGKLRGLELFVAQAGTALENLSLHRKLDSFHSRLSPLSPEQKEGKTKVRSCREKST